MGGSQVEQPMIGKVGVGPALTILSINLNHVPPFTPFSRVVNMRSVETWGLVHDQRSRTTPPGLARYRQGRSGIGGGVDSLRSFIPHPPSCVPSLLGSYSVSSLLWTL